MRRHFAKYLMHFNPRPPRGGRLIAFDELTHFTQISIHAPREGGDVFALCSSLRSRGFQSTPPARGATAYPRH